MWKTKFSSHKHYLFGVLFSRNEKKTHTDQSMLSTFLLCLKRNISQTLKSNSCKQVFPKCIYHWYNLLRWMFFIPCDNSKTFFFIQTYRCATAMLLRSLKQVFWKKSVFYIHYLHNNIIMLLIPQRSKIKLLLYKCSSQNLFLDSYFLFLWMFHIFSLQMEFLKHKNSKVLWRHVFLN